jgi:cyclophilin family peptidyl-prolyl cis-trans isomerase
MVMNKIGVKLGKTNLCYKNSTFHKIIPGLLVQGGKIVTPDTSSYGKLFKDEPFTHSHDEAGVLSMANSGPNTNGTQFFVTTAFCDWFDSKHVAFGKLEAGMDVLNQMQYCGKMDGTLSRSVKIIDCGSLN